MDLLPMVLLAPETQSPTPVPSVPPKPTVLGCTQPRIFTPPLRELTPETSFGFEVIDFARDILMHPLDPWQEWAVIHAGELLEDGRPRFRTVLILVSRQNGKTEIPVVLSAWWQFICRVPLILGTSTKLEYAKESWTKAVRLVENSPFLDQYRSIKKWTRDTNGEQESWTIDDKGRPESRYKIAASNAQGGRSLTIGRLILDELREHHTYDAWNASESAGNAVDHFQVWCLSNAGDDRSIVLNELRESCLDYIGDPDKGDERTGLFEWSADEHADPLDIHALAQANPSLGTRIRADTLLGKAKRAVAKGGEVLTGFKTENMCIRVKLLNPAIDPGAWKRCFEDGTLKDANVKSRVALCVDISPDGEHASLAAAAVLEDGRTRVEIVDAWDGPGATDRLRTALPGLVARIKPRTLGYFPSGPAAALAADLADRTKTGKRGMLPAGLVAEIRGETTAVCMGFEEQVKTGNVAHAGDPLLNAHVSQAERLKRGDAWAFVRRGDGSVDAVYAAAGAVHIARTMPTNDRLGIIVIDDD